MFQIPDIYDCIKYDVEHNRAVLENTDAWKVVVELYTNVQVLEIYEHNDVNDLNIACYRILLM